MTSCHVTTTDGLTYWITYTNVIVVEALFTLWLSCLGMTLNSSWDSINFVSRIVAQTTQADTRYRHLLPFCFGRPPTSQAERSRYRNLLALSLRLNKSIVSGASQQGRDFFKHCSSISTCVQQRRGMARKHNPSPQWNKHPFRAEKRFSDTQSHLPVGQGQKREQDSIESVSSNTASVAWLKEKTKHIEVILECVQLLPRCWRFVYMLLN